MRKTRIAIITLMIALILVLWYSLFAKNEVYDLVVHLSSFIKDSPTGAATFVMLAAFSAMISPFSSVPLVPIAIVIWGPFLTSFMLLAGWLIGGVFSYAIGWKFGYALVSSFIPHEKIDKWSKQLERKVSIFLVLVFRIMTPSETGYIFGILRYPFLTYTLITLLSEIPFAFAISYAGSAILENEQQIFWLLAVASAAFLGLAYQAYRREFKRRA
jgi:uncharacterized membrane protein YdjX (TVP38/TMEM64 family)